MRSRLLLGCVVALWVAFGGVAALWVFPVGVHSALAQDMKISQLKPIGTQRDYALLFIHGLNGSSASFADWINVVRHDHDNVVDLDHTKVRLSQFDIFVADYKTRDRNVSIHEIGQFMAQELGDSALLQRYDLVWVVVHSLGGLVFHQASQNLLAQNKQVYFRFVPAVLELGVPVSGSEFASVAGKLGPDITSYLGFDPRIVKELESMQGNDGNNYLDNMNKLWTDFVMKRHGTDGWPIVSCGYETLYEARIAKLLGVTNGQVVPQLYTSNACHGARQAVPSKHTEMHKVTAATDAAHKLLRDTVRTSLLELRSKRYKRSRSSLYEALTNIEDSSGARDNTTAVTLYKYRVAFSDPTGRTKAIALQQGIAGWSLQDAVRQLASTYANCLSVKEMPAEGKIEIGLKEQPRC